MQTIVTDTFVARSACHSLASLRFLRQGHSKDPREGLIPKGEESARHSAERHHAAHAPNSGFHFVVDFVWLSLSDSVREAAKQRGKMRQLAVSIARSSCW